MNNAQAVCLGQQNLSDSIHIDTYKTADSTMGDVAEFVEFLDPYIAVVGFVTGFIKLFLPSDTDKILAELDKIEKQIDFLQQDM